MSHIKSQAAPQPRRLRFHDRREAGFTLVELVVYMMLFLIVVGMVATLTIQMIRVQRDVTVSAAQNQSQQVVFTEISRSIRNAAEVRVAGDGNILVLSTFTGDEEAIIGVANGVAGNINDPSHWTCRAWVFNPANRTLYASTLPSEAGDASGASVAAIPSLVSGSGWRPVLEEVDQGSGPQMFTVVPAIAVASNATFNGVAILSGNGTANSQDEVWVSMLADTTQFPEPRPSIGFDTRVSLRSGSGTAVC